MEKKILIIDDSELYRIVVKKELEAHGYKDLLTVGNGKEGIAIAKREKPNLVIMDVVLPDGNGLEFCREIKDALGDKIKVIVSTGFIDAADIGKALNAGADNFVSKTVDLSSLRELVKRLLK